MNSGRAMPLSQQSRARKQADWSTIPRVTKEPVNREIGEPREQFQLSATLLTESPVKGEI
jgi:hypothetical protein